MFKGLNETTAKGRVRTVFYQIENINENINYL